MDLFVGDGLDVASDHDWDVLVERLKGFPCGLVDWIALPVNVQFPVTVVETMVVNPGDECSSAAMCSKFAQLWRNNEILVGITFEEIGVHFTRGGIDNVSYLENSRVDALSDLRRASPEIASLVLALLVGTAY